MMPMSKLPTASDKAGTARGLLVVNTGNGKGKTTAALGLLLRAWGHDLRVVMLQFIKNSHANFGEHRAARKIGLEIIAGGDGFSRPGISSNLEKSRDMAVCLWETSKQKIQSGNYDMVILDEISYPIQFGWLPIDDVIDVISHRPASLHIVVTGRGVPPSLITIADTVTELTEVKHAYHQGIKAQRGMEF